MKAVLMITTTLQQPPSVPHHLELLCLAHSSGSGGKRTEHAFSKTIKLLASNSVLDGCFLLFTVV